MTIILVDNENNEMMKENEEWMKKMTMKWK